jgi:hypothetical protein
MRTHAARPPALALGALTLGALTLGALTLVGAAPARENTIREGAQAVAPAPATPEGEIAAAFAARLAVALETGTAQLDSLWLPDARDSTQRLLDLRAGALFHWDGVRVDVTAATAGTVRLAGETRPCLDADLVVRGTATWERRAYGLASSLWRLQTDETEETNRIVRREAWRLVQEDGAWYAVERVLLAPVEVLDASVRAGVYPGQNTLLVEVSYYLRALVGDVRTLRFLLDRRAEVYDLRVDGTPAPVVRGSALSSLGLEGFSPEVESSLRFPEPLARGEAVHVTFLIRSPLVHLTGEGFVATVPQRSGPFRERAWYPILDPVHGVPTGRTDGPLELSVHWPQGVFAEVALSGSRVASGEPGEDILQDEEEIATATGLGARAADFVLGRPGTALERIDWAALGADPADPLESPIRIEGGTLARPPGADARLLTLDPCPRSRARLVDPLFEASVHATDDLASDLPDLLPMDEEAMDELFEEGGMDAEQGADDRTSE